MRAWEQDRWELAWAPTIALAIVVAVMLPATGTILAAYTLVAVTWLVGRTFTAEKTVTPAWVGLAVLQLGAAIVVWLLVWPMIRGSESFLGPLSGGWFLGVILLACATVSPLIVLFGAIVEYFTGDVLQKQG